MGNISLYVFKKLEEKLKTRFTCVASTADYPIFENKRVIKPKRETEKRPMEQVGDLLICLNDVSPNFNATAHEKFDKAVTLKGKNFSSFVIPKGRTVGYGDYGNDAVIIELEKVVYHNKQILADSVLKVYIFKGQRMHKKDVYLDFVLGIYNDEISALKLTDEKKLSNTYI